MALSKEDHGDVKRAFGKALANKVAKTTRDSINSRIELNRQASGGGAEGRVPHLMKVVVATKDGSTHKFDNLKHYGNDNKRSLVSRDTPRYKNLKS